MDQSKVTKWSFLFMLLVLATIGVSHLATPFLAVLFAYFILRRFQFVGQRWIAIALFLILVGGIFYGFYFFVREAIIALPKIAGQSIPIIIEQAQKHGFELPFSDLGSLKALVVDAISDQVKGLARFAQIATEDFVFLLIGLVVAISLFVNSTMDLNQGNYPLPNNLYSRLCEAIQLRFRNFYQSFSTVMGAQLIISLINTVLTSIMVFSVGLPYAKLVVVVTFLCGMIPIIGNVVSNGIIFGIAVTVSLRLSVIALIFLIAIHKLEYFLNSKIIGGKIKNPMWLTLLALIVGERVMGIPGMVLAPVILHYLKTEASRIEIDSVTP